MVPLQAHTPMMIILQVQIQAMLPLSIQDSTELKK